MKKKNIQYICLILKCILYLEEEYKVFDTHSEEEQPEKGKAQNWYAEQRHNHEKVF